MRLDPVTTFFVYLAGITVTLTVCAAVADLWAAKAERDARRRARAEARAKLRGFLASTIIIYCTIGAAGASGGTKVGATQKPVRASERCPDAHAGLRWYRSRYVAHRAARGLTTPRPVGRKPRNCVDARWLARDLWPKRSRSARLATEAWLLNRRTLDERDTWLKAIQEVQVAWPGTETWLRSCSATEGAGRNLSINHFVMNRQGSGAGGWLQFMESTFWRMFTAGKADAEARGFIVPDSAASWRSRIGQAIAGAWAVTHGRRGEWSGTGC